MPRKKEPSFEENLAQLEKVVELLEYGDASLDDIMKHYANGMDLSKKCMEAIKRAEKEIDVVLSVNGDAIDEAQLEIKGE